MNAKQIADELENIYWIQGDGKGKPFQQYADFVRQQQAEIEALKQSKSDGNNKVNTKPVAWMSDESFEVSTLNIGRFSIPLYTHPANKKVEKNTDLYEKVCNCTKKLDLTDEEISQVYKEVSAPFGEKRLYEIHDFARAILRKAQDK